MVDRMMKLRKIGIAVLFLVVILLPLLFLDVQKGITGMTTLETINQTFTESTVLTTSYTNITSLKATGTSYAGISRVYLQTTNGSLLTIIENMGNNTFVDSCIETCNMPPTNGNLYVLLRDNATLNLQTITTDVQPAIGIVQQIIPIQDINLSNTTTINLSTYFIETMGAHLNYAANVPSGVRAVLFDDVLFLSERDAGSFNATITASNGQMNISTSFIITVAGTIIPSFGIQPTFETQPVIENTTTNTTETQSFGIQPFEQQLGITAQASIDSVILNSTTGANQITENLTAYPQNAVNGTEINYDWRLNETSIAVLNLPMTAPYNNGTHNITFGTSNYNTNVFGVFPSTAQTPVWNATGKYGGAYSFDGSADYITISSVGKDMINAMTNNISVELWFNARNAAGAFQPIFTNRRNASDNTNLNFYLDVNAGSLRCISGNAAGDILSFTVTSNQWYHVICTRDTSANKLILYVNGTNVAQDTALTARNTDTTKAVYIGTVAPFSTFFSGTIDEVRIYNRSLSPEQVSAIYNNSAPRYDRLVPNETGGIGNIWTTVATPIDSTGLNGTGVLSNNLTISGNLPPTITSVILNSTTGNNLTTENLTAYPQGITDINSDNVSVNYDWRLNGTSIAVLNLPMTAPFNNGSRNLTWDFSSFGNNGVMNETAPTWNASGKYGGAYTFDGVNDEIRISNAVNLSGLTSMSISVWAYSSAGALQKAIVGWWDGANGLFIQSRTATGDGLLVVGGDGNDFGQVAFTTTKWTHAVLVYNGSESTNANKLKLYADGTLQTLTFDGAASIPSSLPNIGVNTFKIGMLNGVGRYWTGSIDEVQVYNRSLSAQEIQAIYNNSAPRYDRLVSNELGIAGNNWSVLATPINSQGLNGTGVPSNNLTIAGNQPPTITNVSLNSTTGNNLTTENLTAYPQGITDINSDNVSVNYDWRLNGSSIAVLNLPMTAQYNNGTHNLTFDFSNFSNVGIMSGTTTPTWKSNGKYGGAYNFNGNQIIDFKDTTSLNIARNMTILAWVNFTTSQSNRPIVARWGGDQSYTLYVDATTSNKLGFTIRVAETNKNAVSTKTYNDGQWHFIAGIYNGTHVKLMINGTAEDITGDATAGPIDTPATNVRIGNYNSATTNGFVGDIDEVMIFNRSLSKEEILAIYNNSAPRYDRLVSNELGGAGNNWSVKATPIDIFGLNGTGVLSNNLTVLNSPPSITSVILNSTTGANLTTENLTAYPQSAVNSVEINYDWRLNGTSMALLNLPMTAPFNNGSRNLTWDFSTFNNVGVMNGSAPTWNASGKYGGAYTFDGVDDFMQTNADSTSLAFKNTNNFAFEMWMQTADTTTSIPFIVRTFSAGALSYHLALNRVSGKISFETWDGSTNQARSNTQITDTVWHHIAGTYTASTRNMSIYIDGAYENSSQATAGGTASTVRVTIGSNDVGNPFKGSIDEFRIYNRTLSAEEIFAIYNNSAPRYDRLVSNELGGAGNNWSVLATPIDSLGLNGTGVPSNNLTIVENLPPTIASVILNSTSGNNLTTDNLTAYPQGVTDINGDNVSVNYDWRLNGSSIAVLNLPMTAPFNNGSRNLTWDFSSNNVISLLGNDSDGTTQPTWNASGKYGGAYTFDGIDDRIKLPDSIFDTQNIGTFEAWINPGHTSENSGISSIFTLSNSAATNQIIQVSIINGGIRFFGRNNAGTTFINVNTTTAITKNAWSHLVVTMNATGVNIYINGTNQTLSFTTGNAQTNYWFSNLTGVANKYTLGNTEWPDPFRNFNPYNGTIDEVRIYNRTLSAEEIFAIYNNSAPRYDRLVSNELGGAGNNWSVLTTPIDSTGLNGTGVPSNNLTIVENLPPQDFCGTINTSITLLTGVNTTQNNCFDINTSNIILNCANHNITGPGNGIAINITSQPTITLTNITIQNCNIHNFTTGISINRTTNISITNTNFTNVDTAIEINNTNNITITSLISNTANWSIKTNSTNLSITDPIRILNYTIRNTLLKYTQTGIAEIQFTQAFDNIQGANLSQNINLTTNRIQINTTRNPQFNASANLTLLNNFAPVIQAAYDDTTFETCKDCSYPTNASGNMKFAVNHFTTYRGTGVPVSTCRTVNDSMRMTQNIAATGGTCFDINTTGITFDCAGYNITSNPKGTQAFNITQFTTGSTQINISNIVIQNCNIRNFTIGINATTITNITLLNNNISNSTYGIQLTNITGGTIQNNTLNTTQTTITTTSSTQLSFENNNLTSRDNRVGLYIVSQTNNNYAKMTLIGDTGLEINNSAEITFNNITFQNTNQSIKILNSSVTITDTERITNYSINNATNFVIMYTNKSAINYTNGLNATGDNLTQDINITANKVSVNTTRTPALNTTAQVTFYGTNAIRILVSYDGTNFETCPSDLCTGFRVTNRNTIFNVSHFTDYIPDGIGIANCQTINETSNLVQNVDAAGTSCLDFNQSNILFDCAGYNVTSNPQGTTAINITTFVTGTTQINLSNITIKNCNIFNFSVGINVSSAANINLFNNNITLVTKGVMLNNTARSVLENNIANATLSGITVIKHGLFLTNSSNNTINNNNFSSNSNNAIGIFLTNSPYNVLSNNFVNALGSNSFGIEIQLSKSTGNVLTNNTIRGGYSGCRLNGGSNNVLTLNTCGLTTSNSGILFGSRGSNNTFLNNTFMAGLSAVNNAGFSDNNVFTNNTVIGTTGFEIIDSKNISITNTSFQNTKLSIQTNRGSNVSLVDNERMTNYSFNNTPSLTITKTGIASVNFLNIINANGTNLSRDVNITLNKVYVNSSRSPGLNITANITFFDLTGSNILFSPKVDYFDSGIYHACDSPACIVQDSSKTNYVFTVSSFTTYTIGNICGLVNESVILTSNVLTSNQTCFDFNSSNILFDCAGYNITSNPQGILAFNISNFTAGATMITPTNITIKNCKIINWTLAINVSNANNISILNSTILNVSSGIKFNQVNTSIIKDVTINSTSTTELISWTASHNNTATNMLLVSIDGTTESTALKISSSDNNAVLNNSINLSLGKGIQIEDSTRNIITKNAINATTAIQLTNATNNTITNSTLKSDAGNAIILNNSRQNSIQNNTATSITGYAMLSNNSQQNNILNNTAISNNSYAVVLETSYAEQIMYNTLSGASGAYLLNTTNTTLNKNNITTPNTAIQIINAENNTITNNTAISTNGNAIMLNNSQQNTVLNNTATSTNSHAISLNNSRQNNILNNTAISTNSNAIVLNNSAQNFIQNNTAISINSYAIDLETAQHNQITQNSLNGTIAIYLQNSINTTITNNTLARTTGIETNDSNSTKINTNIFQTPTSLKSINSQINLTGNTGVKAYTITNTLLTIVNTSTGAVEYTQPITANNINLTTDITINQNLTIINTTNTPALNQPAKFTFNNIHLTNPLPFATFIGTGPFTGKFVPCTPPTCINHAYDGETYQFSAISVGTFAINENITIQILDTGGTSTQGSAAPTKIMEKLDATPEYIKTKIKQGETKTEKITLTNKGVTPIKVSIKGISGMIKIPQTLLNLQPGETREPSIIITAAETEQPDVYTYDIEITAGNTIKQTIPVIIDVVEKSALFDIQVNLAEKPLVVMQGETATGEVILYNFGEIAPIDVTLQHSFKTIDGKEIFSEEETFAVHEQKQVIKTIKIPEDQTPGHYLFYAKATYGKNQIATASGLLKIIEKPKPEPLTTAATIEKAVMLNKGSITLTTAGIMMLILAIGAVIHIGLEQHRLKQIPFIKTEEFAIATKWAAEKLKHHSEEKVLLALLNAGMAREQITSIIRGTRMLQSKHN